MKKQAEINDAAQTIEQVAQAPTDVEQVVDSIQGSLLAVWSDFVDHTPFLVAGIAVLALTWLAAMATRKIADRIAHRSDVRGSLRDLIERLLSIAVWAAGLMLAAMIVFPGLTPASALGALGVASIAISFAFKDIFENFLAGIFLLWRFPFEKGDFIECDGITGRVEEITIRMTQVRKVTGELVVMPNSTLFQNPVDVLTDQRRRRVTIMTGVGYDEDVAHAVEVIQKAVSSCDTVHGDEDIEIFPQAFGASSIDIEVTWWCDPEPLDVRRSRGQVVTAVKSALDSAGIEIPYPYRTLTFKEPLRMRGATGVAADADTDSDD